MAALVGSLAGTATPVLPSLERWVRVWVARFAPDPEALWIQWARAAHRAGQAHWCLERAARLGGAGALFQEGLAYFDGGFGAGGQIAGTERMGQAARKGHLEAAFWLAESLRTGRGCPRDPAGALLWYQRSATAGFGPAAAWLAEAYALGVGVALLGGLWVGVVATFFLVGASGFFFLPLLMLAPPGIMLAWQAWQLRREMPKQGRDRLRKAAEAGHREAMCALAQAYLGGHGAFRNPREAARWADAARQNPV